MPLSKRHKKLSILFSTVLWITASGAAFADEAKFEHDSVPQSIINLDLCTLAYQLYHQSLCLPLDPWYDLMSRVGSDRRSNICRYTREYAKALARKSADISESADNTKPAARGKTGSLSLDDDTSDWGFYSGPNEARGWTGGDSNLDPILTNYKHIDIRLPAFTRDGERYLTVAAPAYLTNNIKSIEGVRYRAKPTSFPSNDVEQFKIRDYPSGENYLILFEGGTGVIGKSDPSWSLMGFVVMQKTSKGYDAHIVFRGSRSGAELSKTVWNAQGIIGDSKGNPDWITDLRSGKQVEQPLISTVGKVTEGFAESLPTMLGPIAACCKYLDGKYQAPDHIYVTGHSLGAGLASQFVSAVEQGNYGKELRSDIKNWPWDKTTLVAYAQPIPGDPVWAASFDKTSPESEHYWVEGDTVVEATSNSVVSRLIDKGEHSGVQKKLVKIAECNDNPHEVFVIRAALLNDFSSKKIALAPRLLNDNTWAYYKSFSKMLAGQSESYVYPNAPSPKIITEENLQKILQNYNFGEEFNNWLEEVYAKMIAEKSSYIAFKSQSTLDERKKKVDEIVKWMRTTPMSNKAQELDSLANEFKIIDGQLGLTAEEHWIYCGMILSRLQQSALTMDELRSKEPIKNCLEADVD